MVIALGHILCTGWLYDLALSASVNGMDFLYTLFGEVCIVPCYDNFVLLHLSFFHKIPSQPATVCFRRAVVQNLLNSVTGELRALC